MSESGKMSQTTYYVYILRCQGGSLYTGITIDVARRLREHLSGVAPGARYTRTHPPQALEVVWQTAGRVAASRLEYRLKRLPASRKAMLVQQPSAVETLEGLDSADLYTPLAPQDLVTLWRQATEQHTNNLS